SACKEVPTAGVPTTFGAATLLTAASLKWMKPSGHPRPLPMRRQLKSPPQLSSDTMISVGDTTCSTYATCPLAPPEVPLRHQAIAPTIGVESVILAIATPQWVALPSPVHGRLLAIPLCTRR